MKESVWNCDREQKQHSTVRKRRRSWRTWNRCFCRCYDGSMFWPV